MGIFEGLALVVSFAGALVVTSSIPLAFRYRYRRTQILLGGTDPRANWYIFMDEASKRVYEENLRTWNAGRWKTELASEARDLFSEVSAPCLTFLLAFLVASGLIMLIAHSGIKMGTGFPLLIYVLGIA